jgi:uncharacterized protein YndB with AHSA1/START domain
LRRRWGGHGARAGGRGGEAIHVVITLAAPPERVWCELADMEALPGLWVAMERAVRDGAVT